MTDIQASEIIEGCIQAHWPKWQFKGQELVVWVRELRKFEFDTAKEGINDLYLAWEKTTYPKLPHIMKAIRSRIKAQHRGGRFCRLYQIERRDGRPRWFPFWGNSRTPEHEIQKQAEAMRDEADRLHPGEEHIVRYFALDEPEPEPAARYDPGAKERAFNEILNGPDAKTKRWLQAYLNRRSNTGKSSPSKKAAQQKEPALVGEVLDDIPF